MKLKEWIDFNKDVFNGDLLITLIRNSYKRDDLILENYLSVDDAYTIFGNYELKRALIGHAEGSDHYAIKVILWPE
jgi:hypothetical protein